MLLLLGGCAEDSKTVMKAVGEGNAGRGRRSTWPSASSATTAIRRGTGQSARRSRGSSRELLEARLLRGDYPPDYTPKRDTAIMQPMPQLAWAISDLAAYLK